MATVVRTFIVVGSNVIAQGNTHFSKTIYQCPANRNFGDGFCSREDLV